jgi:hypothetical protein
MGEVISLEQQCPRSVLREHALLAVEHGIVIHRASLEWVRSAMTALGETSPVP